MEAGLAGPLPLALTFAHRRRTLVWFGTSGQGAQTTPETA